MTNDIADDKKVPEFITEYTVELRRLAISMMPFKVFGLQNQNIQKKQKITSH